MKKNKHCSVNDIIEYTPTKQKHKKMNHMQLQDGTTYGSLLIIRVIKILSKLSSLLKKRHRRTFYC